MKRYIIRGLLVGLLLTSVAAAPATAANNLGESNTGPDPASFSNNYAGAYFTMKEDFNDQLKTRLVIYSPKPDIAVYISSADLCGSRSINGMQDALEIPLSGGTPINDILLIDNLNKSNAASATGVVRGSSYCDEASTLPNFPKNGDTYSKNYSTNGLAKTTAILRLHAATATEIKGFGNGKFYAFDLNIDNSGSCGGVTKCYLNFFRVQAYGIDTDGGGNVLRENNIFISPGKSTENTAQFGIAPNKTGASTADWTNYGFFFAAPCSAFDSGITRLVDQEIKIYDDDNYDNDEWNTAQDPQPGRVPNDPEFRPFELRLQRLPTNNPNIDVTDMENWKDENRKVEEVHITKDNRIFWNGSNVMNPDSANVAHNEYVERWLRVGIKQRKDAIITLKFDMDKDYAYRIRFRDIYFNNNLQFSLPFDTIWANQVCDPPPKASVFPTVNLGSNDSVLVDENVTAQFGIRNRSAEVPGSARYTRNMWLDNGDQIFGSGDSQRGFDSAMAGPLAIPVAPGLTNLAGKDLTTTAEEGYRFVCASLTIESADARTTDIDSSTTTACKLIAKKPSMQVLGGDARSGGVYQQSMASCLVESNYLYAPIVGANYGIDPDKGSFSEYNVKSTGKIQKFGSSNSPPGLDLTTVSLLFGNTTDGALSWRPTSDDGYFNGDASNWEKTTHCLPNFFAKYQHPTPQQTVGNGSMVGGSISGATSGSYTLNAGRITLGCSGECVVNGRRVIYVRNTDMPGPIKTLAITSNFVYPSASVSISSLPHFVLMVDSGINVQFASGVTRFDGILVTKGGIYTCDYGLDDVKTSTCNDQLIVNGAAVTSRALVPIRTYGDGTIGKPAEQFKLTPEALVSDYQNSIQTQGITTTDQKELPPRL